MNSNDRNHRASLSASASPAALTQLPSNRLALALAAVAAVVALSACNTGDAKDSTIASAKEAMTTRDLKAAEIHLKNLLQKSPDNPEGRYLLGKLYFEAGDYRAAEKEYRLSIEKGYDRNIAVPKLLETLFQLGESKKILEESPNLAVDQIEAKAEVLNIVGRANFAMGKKDEAKAKFEAAVGMKPDYIPGYVSLVQMRAANGDRAGANSAVDNLLKQYPTSVEALAMKGDLLLTDGKLAEAKEYLIKVVAGSPTNAIARGKLSAILIDLQDYPAAKIELTELGKLSPNSPGTLHLKALFEFRTNNLAAAQEFVQAALKVSPDYLPAISLAGNIYLANNTLEQAERSGRMLIERQPNALQGYRLLAATYLKMNQPERAMQTVTPLLDKGVEDATLLAIAGEAALKGDDPTKASKYFERAIKLDPKDAGKRTGLALSRLATGQRDSGYTELETAVTLDSTNYQADFALIMARMRDKEYDKALEAVAVLEKKQTKSPVPFNLRGMIYTAKGDIPNAKKGFSDALAMDAAFFPAAANLASLDVRENRPEDAKKRYEAILAKDPKNHQAYIALARHASRYGGTKEQILDLLQKAKNQNPGLIPPVLALSTFLIEQNTPKDAVPILQEAIQQNPDKAELLDLLGMSFLRMNDRGQALETYEKMVRLDPNSANLHYRMAELKAGLRDDVGAIASFKKAAELQPKAVEPQIAMASILLRTGKKDEARAIATKLQKELPNSPAGLVLNGDLSASEQNWPVAIETYKKALAVQKTPSIAIKLYAALVRGGKQPEADQLTTTLIKENPEDLAVRMFAGEQGIANKRWAEALENYAFIIKREPNNGVALNNMAWAMYQLKDPKALQLAEQAYAALPQNPAVMDTFGYLSIEIGNANRGLELLRQATALAPKAGEIRIHLAQALAKTGDKDGAKREIDTVLKENPNGPVNELAKEAALKF